MAQVILVTSFKGGVGKTTISAGLAVRLNELGNKVLVCDCDLESRCLDIVLGIENQPLFNICDVIAGRCDTDKAILKDERFSRLYFMPAPAFYPEAIQQENTSDIFTEEGVNRFINEVSSQYDYVILDLPARPDMLYRRLVMHADRVIVVSFHTTTSIRSAEKTAMAIHEMRGDRHRADVKLVVNGFRPDSVKSGDNVGLYDIISKTGLGLLGVIPYDEELVKSQETGTLPSEHKKGKFPFWQAICNTADRLEGKNVSLLKGIKLKDKSRLC